MRGLLAASFVVAVGGCADARPPEIDAVFDLASGEYVPVFKVLRAGGLSGIAFTREGELLAVSDDRVGPRVLMLRVHENPFRLEPTGMISLTAPKPLDAEGIALLPNGNLLVSSEGVQNEVPRTAPGIFEFTRDGEFVATLPLRNKFVPPMQGPITAGVRGNASFEALATTSDGTRVFTAAESPLVQDDEPPGFDRGGRTRILEYTRIGNDFVQGREWVYELEPIGRPDFPTSGAINGLVELVALDNGDLLALERSYAAETDGPRYLQHIRVYQVSLRGATDVSTLDSLADRRSHQPVTKRLIVDLGRTPGLPSELSALDNFEGMAFAPPGSDGRRRLLLVSDDNFSADQRTWFVRVRY